MYILLFQKRRNKIPVGTISGHRPHNFFGRGGDRPHGFGAYGVELELCNIKNSDFCIFTARKRSVARCCHDKLSVGRSVTLVYCDHMRWNSSKIISRMTIL